MKKNTIILTFGFLLVASQLHATDAGLGAVGTPQVPGNDAGVVAAPVKKEVTVQVEVPAPALKKTPKPEQVSGFVALDKFFGEWVVGPIATVMFWDAFFWDNGTENDAKFPFVVLWLVLGAIFSLLKWVLSIFVVFGMALNWCAGNMQPKMMQSMVRYPIFKHCRQLCRPQ